MEPDVRVRIDPAHLLRSRGLQVTAQRLAVLRAVAARPHGSADAIAREARIAIGTISRQAVYDALAILTEHGLVRRIQPAGSPALFDPRVGDNHHHAICRGCGRVADVDCSAGEAPCLHAAGDSGYVVDEAEILFWGSCPACATARAERDRSEKSAGTKTPKP